MRICLANVVLESLESKGIYAAYSDSTPATKINPTHLLPHLHLCPKGHKYSYGEYLPKP